MKLPYIVFLFSFAASIAAIGPSTASSNSEESFLVDRYALYVASNDGGPTRKRLRYAGTDAEKIAQTLSEVGGVQSSKSILLIDPRKEDIDNAFETFSKSIRNTKGKVRRTEFIFYYSGHSDESSLILGRESYGYSDLKKALNDVPSDVHVVMLDSCFSGNFVRTKGGTRLKPFLMDDSTVVQGHAYLSSSSEVEASQESDKIQASYFTHALVTGLRGAADTSGDNRVSLNELYHYAFNETLAKTESSIIGPQHPSYNITLVGSGDLVLTDITDAESMIYIPSIYEGKYFIRNMAGILVSEINKIRGTEVALALPAGYYTISIVTPSTTSQALINLDRGNKMSLDAHLFGAIPRTPGIARGESLEEIPPYANTEEELAAAAAYAEAHARAAAGGSSTATAATAVANSNETTPIAISAFMANDANIEGLQLAGFMATVSQSLTGIQVAGFLSTVNGSFKGIQVAGFLNTITSANTVNGMQVAGFMNTVSGPFNGFQIATFMNTTKDFLSGFQITLFMNSADSGFDGFQLSNFLNTAGGQTQGVQVSPFINIANSISGAQIGLINIAKSNTGISLGLFNFISDGIMSPALYFDTNGLSWMQYQGGTPTFFTSFMLGAPVTWGENIDLEYGVFGCGIGHRFSFPSIFKQVEFLNRFSIDLELITKHILNEEFFKGIESLSFKTESEANKAFFNLSKGNIPSLRLTTNIHLLKHLSFFAAWNADLNIYHYNDNAFTYGSNGRAVDIEQGRAQLFTNWSFGIRF